MAIQFTNPHLNLLTNSNLKKTEGKQSTPLDNSSPLESPYYAISQQARKELQPIQPQQTKTPSLSTLLQTAQSEIRRISKQVSALKDLASRAADTTQTDDARSYFQQDFYSGLGKINEIADNMSWDGMIISQSNNRYKINQVSNRDNNYYGGGKVQGWNNTDEAVMQPFRYKGIVDISEVPGARSTTEINFQGNLNANAAPIAAIDSYTTVGYTTNIEPGKLATLTLTNGTQQVVTNGGRYTVGNSIPVTTTVQVYDSQGMAHNIPIQLEKTSANRWVASLASLTTAGTYPTENGTLVASMTSVYSYIKESDGTYTRVSFINNDGTLANSFPINFTTTGQTYGTLTCTMRLEYNFDALPANSTDEPKMFVQRPGGLYTYRGSDGHTYVTSNLVRPSNYLNILNGNGNNTPESISTLLRNYAYTSAINGASTTESTVNFSGLTQYVGQFTAYPSANGSTEEARQQMNQQNSQGGIPLNQNTLPFDNRLMPMGTFNSPLAPPSSPAHYPMHDTSNSNQPIINIYFGNMHTRFLGTGDLIAPQGRFLNSFDQQRYDSFSGNSYMQNDWMEIVMGAANKNLSSINLMSQRNAAIALRVIEGALTQVQRELSTVNSYIQRFSQTIDDVQATNTNNNPYNNRMLHDNLV